MSGSTGQDKFEKYFQNKTIITTTKGVKSNVYKNKSGREVLDVLPDKTSIEIKGLSDWTKGFRYPISYTSPETNKNMTGFLTDANVRKPQDEVKALNLKPQAFNVKDKNYSLTEYIGLIQNTILERKDIPEFGKKYLLLLFNYFAIGDVSDAELMEAFKQMNGNISVKNINKDFGEVIGPVAIFGRQIFKKYGIELSHDLKIFMPLKPNEPLMDFALYDKELEMTISSKSGTTTNVVKPNDIIDLLKCRKEDKFYDKWKDSNEFKILDILGKFSIIKGPIQAISTYNNKWISQNGVDSIKGEFYDKEEFKGFLEQFEYFKKVKEPTINEIRYECEKYIQELSKNGTLKYNELFADAIKHKVYYVMFELDSKGIPKLKTIIDSDLTAENSKTAFLRTKGYYKKSGDKMGIQL